MVVAWKKFEDHWSKVGFQPTSQGKEDQEMDEVPRGSFWVHTPANSRLLPISVNFSECRFLLLLSMKMNLYHLHEALNLQIVLTPATLLPLYRHVYLDKSNLPFVNVCCLYLLYYIKVEIELPKKLSCLKSFIRYCQGNTFTNFPPSL